MKKCAVSQVFQQFFGGIPDLIYAAFYLIHNSWKRFRDADKIEQKDGDQNPQQDKSDGGYYKKKGNKRKNKPVHKIKDMVFR